MSGLPERDGKFHAYPIEWGVEPSPKTQAIAFACRYRITEWLDPVSKAWHPYHHLEREITGRTYFVRADGAPSPTGIDQLRTALGWDGVDLKALQETDWTQRGVTIQIDWDEYQGKSKLKMQWLDSWEGNGFGGGGGIKRADASALQAFQNRLGAQLRATAPKPAGGPPPPPAATASPRVPAGGPPPPPPAKAANPIPPGPPATAGDVPEDEIPFAWIGALLASGLWLLPQALPMVLA